MTSLPPGSKPGDQLRFDSLVLMTGVSRYLVYLLICLWCKKPHTNQ